MASTGAEEKTAGPAQGASDAPLLRGLSWTGGRAHRDDGGAAKTALCRARQRLRTILEGGRL